MLFLFSVFPDLERSPRISPTVFIDLCSVDRWSKALCSEGQLSKALCSVEKCSKPLYSIERCSKALCSIERCSKVVVKCRGVQASKAGLCVWAIECFGWGFPGHPARPAYRANNQTQKLPEKLPIVLGALTQEIETSVVRFLCRTVPRRSPLYIKHRLRP